MNEIFFWIFQWNFKTLAKFFSKWYHQWHSCSFFYIFGLVVAFGKYIFLFRPSNLNSFIYKHQQLLRRSNKTDGQNELKIYQTKLNGVHPIFVCFSNTVRFIGWHRLWSFVDDNNNNNNINTIIVTTTNTTTITTENCIKSYQEAHIHFH